MRLAAPPLQAADAGRPRRAVFIDKDGTLVENVPYNVDPALLRFTEGAITALRRLQAAGYLLVVVSNQPGIALQRFDLPALEGLARALCTQLAAAGVRLAGFYACPHAPALDGASPKAVVCRCRKPAAGLFREAASDHDIDLGRSWMVGDILDDIEAGSRAGCSSVLLDVGNETEWRWSPIRIPDFHAMTLDAAATAILAKPRGAEVAQAAASPGHPAPRWGQGAAQIARVRKIP